MNLDIFNKEDKSGKFSKESYLMKNFKEEYDFIISYSLTNNLGDIPFKEKVYLSINNMQIPACKNPSCNNRPKFKNSTLGYNNYCSNRCIGLDPEIISKKEKKSIEKYGTKSPAKSQIVLNKIIKTNIERYGSRSPLLNDNIIKKSKDTLMNNWGVDNPGKSKEITKKRIEKFKSSNYIENYKKSCMEKWGVDNPWKNKDIHKKSVDSSILIKNINLEKSILNKINNLEYDLLSIDFSKIKREIYLGLCDRSASI